MKIINKYFLFSLIPFLSILFIYGKVEKETNNDSVGVKNYDYSITKEANTDIKIKSIKDYGDNSGLIGKAAPSFTFYSYAGEKISFNQFKGKILLLDFWESWCGKCIGSFHEISRIAKEYKSKGIEVLGITTENKKIVEKLIRKNKLVYTNIFADKTIINDYEVSSRPKYILINEDGKIIFVSYGNLKIVENKLKQLISKSSG